MEAVAGQLIKGYELKQFVAQGGFGAIYRGFQSSVGREVAIKVILPHFSSRPEFIRKFDAEAQLVARLEHPHIVPLYDYWRDPDGAYLVMRWLPGGSLRDELLSGALEPSLIVRIIGHISAALAFAHERGVVHRDIKPDNILLDIDKNAYLSDFGIAKALHDDAHLTGDDQNPLSLGYVAPEQALGELVSPQADIYCLGVVLYEMAVGEHPFPSSDPVQQLFKHIHEPLPDLTSDRVGHLEALNTVIQKATAKLATNRYESVLEMYAELEAALRQSDKASSPTHRMVEVHNPFVGLRAFQESDTDRFFGREAIVDQLIDELDASRDYRQFLAVVGPSGSGKSSLVKAGLIPAIRRGRIPGSQNWFILEIQPGARPLDELLAGLTGLAAHRIDGLRDLLAHDEQGLLKAARKLLPQEDEHLLLVIDQFEELFTLTEDEQERVQFLNLLSRTATDPGGRIHIVITLRADFYDRPLMVRGFSDLVRDRTHAIVPLSSEELTRAIEMPAEVAGVQFEPGLSAEIVAEVMDQPGALPLFQYALTELFEFRQGERITRGSYRAIGGVLGALGKRAEVVYSGLDSAGKSIARHIFLRLVTLGEGVEDTRRRVLRTEIDSLQQSRTDIDMVIQAFGSSRLLTFDHDLSTRTPTLEVAHEALIKEWARYREWLEESRQDLRHQRLLAAGAEEWLSADKDPSYLLHGPRLAQFEDWTTASNIALTNLEIAYLDASLRERNAREAAEADRKARETALEKRVRRFLWALVGVFSVASLVAFVLYGTARSAQRRTEAETSARSTQQAIALREVLARGTQQMVSIAESRRLEADADRAFSKDLASAAMLELEADPQLALLLALQAVRAGSTLDGLPLPATLTALHRAVLANSPRLIRFFETGDEQAYRVAFGPRGDRLLTYGAVPGLMSGRLTGQTRFWSLLGDEIGPSIGGFPVSNEWTEAGGLMTVELVGEGSLYLTQWDLQSGNQLHRRAVDPLLQAALKSVAGGSKWSASDIHHIGISPDRRMLSVALTLGGTTHHFVWDLSIGSEVYRREVGADDLDSAQISAISFSQDSNRIGIGTSSGQLTVWDFAEETAVLSIDRLAGTVHDIAFNLSGDVVAIGLGCDKVLVDDTLEACSASSGVRLWHIGSGREVTTGVRFDREVRSVAVSRDGSLLAAGGVDGSARLWSLQGGKLQFTLHSHDAPIVDLAFGPAANQFATAWQDGSVGIWDLRDDFGFEGPVFGEGADTPGSLQLPIALHSGLGLLAMANSDGSVSLWDASSGKLVSELSGVGAEISRLKFDAAGTVLAALDVNGALVLWSSDTWTRLAAIAGFDSCCFALGPDSRLVAISESSTSIGVFETQALIATADTYAGKLYEIVLSHSRDASSHAPDQMIAEVAFSFDGALLAVSGADRGGGYVRFYRSGSGDEVLHLESNSPSISKFAFSRDEQQLAIAGSDGKIVLRTLPTGAIYRAFSAHAGPVAYVEFAEDDASILTVGQDGTAKMWDAKTGHEQLRLTVTARGVVDAAFNGSRLYVRGVDSLTRVFILDPGELIELAESRLFRSFTPEECQKYLRQLTCP